MGANDANEKPCHLGHGVETDQDIRDIRANADRIASGILSGEPIDEALDFSPPGEDRECAIRRQLTTAKTPYVCTPLRAGGTLRGRPPSRRTVPNLPHESR